MVASSDNAITWLDTRLQLDRRATDLLAWLLGQTAARLSAADDPSAPDHAPGGDGSLIFSEYADTIDYLRALLGALHCNCARFSSKVPGVRSLSVTLGQADQASANWAKTSSRRPSRWVVRRGDP